MPTPKATRFTSFEFTEEEMHAATRFSPLTLMLIQSLAADVLERRMDLRVDLASGKVLSEASIEFMQQEAALQGEISAYEHLIMLAADPAVPTPKPEGA